MPAAGMPLFVVLCKRLFKRQKENKGTRRFHPFSADYKPILAMKALYPRANHTTAYYVR
jgi:hypothetical protein